jgi:hypothetical protein
MRMFRWAPFAVVACAAAAGAAETRVGVVVGDSEGVGVAMASGLKGLARISVFIRGGKAVAQINQAPTGATAFVVLGSNDAEGSIKGLDSSIDAILQAAAARNIKLVWIGPPCVRRPWNARVRELDQMLQQRFAGSAVRYVSMWDEKICSGAFYAHDGVHMTMQGYSYMWEKARTAAGFPATAARVAGAPAAGADHKARVRVTHQRRIAARNASPHVSAPLLPLDPHQGG